MLMRIGPTVYYVKTKLLNEVGIPQDDDETVEGQGRVDYLQFIIRNQGHRSRTIREIDLVPQSNFWSQKSQVECPRQLSLTFVIEFVVSLLYCSFLLIVKNYHPPAIEVTYYLHVVTVRFNTKDYLKFTLHAKKSTISIFTLLDPISVYYTSNKTLRKVSARGRQLGDRRRWLNSCSHV